MEKLTTELYDSLDHLFRQALQSLSRGNPASQKIRDIIWDDVYMADMPHIKTVNSKDGLVLVVVKMLLELGDIAEKIEPTNIMALANVKTLSMLISEKSRELFIEEFIKETFKEGEE